MTPSPSTTAHAFPKAATRTPLGTRSIVGMSDDAFTGETLPRRTAGLERLEGDAGGKPSALARAYSEPLPVVAGGFAAILADPPWRFKVRSLKGLGRSAERHYRTMTIGQVRDLPVADVAARDAWLFLWVTGPFLALGVHTAIMRAWGFEPSAIGFVWIKTKRNSGWIFGDDDLPMGLGYTTRHNAEFCILGRRGSPRRLSGGVREVILAPSYRHSQKPPQARHRIEKYCHGPYVELFARGPSLPGWSLWGDEAA